MNKFALFFACLILTFSSVATLAQEPLVKFPSGDSAWTVDVTYPDSSPQNTTTSPHIQKVEVVTKNDIRMSRLTWSDNHTTEVWQLTSPGLQVFEYPTNHAIYVVPSNDSTMLSIMPPKFDQTLFDWLDKDALKGPDDYQGVKCLKYEAKVSVKLNRPGSTTPNATLPPVDYKAWIDKDKLLPVALDNGVSLNLFEFHSPPSQPLVMPEKFQAELKRYQTALAPFKRVINGR
jgi:hypothetical protein